MSDQHQDDHKKLEESLDDWMKSNKHLKWPLIILFIAIVILILLLDICFPNK